MDPKVQKSLDKLKLYVDKPLVEFKDVITREACSLTGSTLSYFATINPAQDVLTMIGWSNSAMINCSTIDKPIVYPVKETGLWGDAVRERKAVITNDYPNLVKPTKKGYPSGHVNVKKHMNLPVMVSGKVALVIGVGNKATDYTNEDTKLLGEFADEAWKILQPKL